MTVFVKRLSLLAAGGALGQIAAAAAMPALSRLYSPGDYGVAGLVQSVVIVLALASTLRYDAVITAGRSARVRAAAFGLSALILLGVATLLTVGVAALIVGGSPVVTPIYFFAPAILVLSTLQTRILPPMLINGDRYDLAAVGSFLSGAGGAAAQIGLGVLGMGAAGLLAGRAAALAAALLSQVAAATRQVIAPAVRRADRAAMRKVAWAHRRQPFVLAPAGFINALAAQLPVFVLAPAFGVGAAGAFFFAQALGNAAIGVYSNAMRPIMARYVRDRRMRGRPVAGFVACVVGVAGAAAFAAAALLYLYADKLVPLVFGAAWAPSAVVFKWIGFYYAVAAVHHPLAALSTIFNFQFAMLVTQVCQAAAVGAALALGVRQNDFEATVALVVAASAIVYAANVLTVFATLRRDDRRRAASVVGPQ